MTAETRRDKLQNGRDKGLAIPHGDVIALSVQHPSTPRTDTYTIPRFLPPPPHCRMCLGAGLLSELLSL